MEERGGDGTYPECKHIPRTLPKEVTEEQIHGLSEDETVDVLPLYELKVSNNKLIKLYSLQTNEKLKCRWKSYVQNIGGMKHDPFEFPSLGDLHIHFYEIKFMPSLTPSNRPTLRMQMAMGPGVDQYGQIPIPCDMRVSTSDITKTKPAKSSKANQN